MPTKVFFDIGTNLFQGYNELKRDLGIDDTWMSVFVEPNPNFLNKTGLKFDGVTGKLVPKALNDNPETKGQTVPFYFMDGRDDSVDQSGGMYNPSYDKVIQVETIGILDLVEPYLDYDEWYFKFDCECAEFHSLPILIAKYPEKIKFVACEFHHRGGPDEARLAAIREQIIQNLAKNNIDFREWH